MNNQERSFLQKVGDNLTQFGKDLIPSPGNAAAFAASPLLAYGVTCAVLTVAAAVHGTPEAVEAMYFGINNPGSSSLLAGLKGELPFEAANSAYQFITGSAGAGLAAAGLTKVAQKFKSLSEETEHLKRENQMLKRNIATEHAVDSGDAQANKTLNDRFSRGFANVNARTEQRHEHEQATRVNTGPKLR
ncbi:MAG: hypothetical protein WC749_01105 [Dehalococcoidia bacterium]|uniref:hypothetical protein n=1 Tax=unclassified Pseudomonas TaxID=196821 RepID=UPI0014764EFE|nr:MULTISPECIES: hypothetical protein [unclassified Pseudomonas]NMX92467.1 hypothetical protein [Pseudomonas sp. WS 5086]NMY47034.1 hypothetical protein [Pseudomonas sp. WS 5027]